MLYSNLLQSYLAGVLDMPYCHKELEKPERRLEMTVACREACYNRGNASKLSISHGAQAKPIQVFQ